MPQQECPTCSVKFQPGEVIVQCIDCETRKHAHCAKIDPSKVGKRHWRCKGCSHKKGPDRKPKSTARAPPSRQMDAKSEEMAAGDSNCQPNNQDTRFQASYDQDLRGTQCDRSLQKLKQLEDLVILLKDKYYEVSKKNDDLQSELTTYKLKVESLEQRIRKNTVEVWGVPVNEKDNLSGVVTRLFHAVNFIDKESQVESVGKVKKTDPDFQAGIRLARVDASVPRTVIWINFVTNRDKDEFMNKWRAREQKGGLSARQLGFNDNGQVKVETSLTSYNLQLFQRAVDYANEFKYQRVGVRDGEIYILKDSNGGPLVFIKSPQDFERLADLDMQRLVNEKVKAAAADTAEERKSPGKTTFQGRTPNKEVSGKPDGSRRTSFKKSRKDCGRGD